MAIAQLGMIITEMAGSIGGTTLKRQGANLSIYNKSRGGNKSKLWQNKGLGRMSTVRTFWLNSSQEYKDAWVDAATRFTFPDRFGNQRNITGYQLYTKATNARAIIELEPTSGDGYDQEVKSFYAKYFTLNKDYLQCRTEIAQGSGRQWYLFGFDVNCKSYSKPIFNKRLILYFFEWNDVGVVDMDTAFWDKFPYVQAGDNVRMYITPMNPQGYKGVTQYYDTTVN